MMFKVMLVQARCFARFSAKDKIPKMFTEAKEVHQAPVKARRTVPLIKRVSQNYDSNKPNQENQLSDVSNPASNVPKFSKIQDLDAQLKRTMLMVKSKKNREKSDRVLLEGKRLIHDAVQSGIMPETIIFSRVEDMKCLSLPVDGIQLYKVPYKTISLWSDMTTCPGIIGIFKTPNVQERQPAGCLPLTVVCDNVREPGNLGAILRVAAGAGCQKVILMKGCVDLWEPKVLRAGSGAHFRVPIHKNVSAQEVSSLISADASVFLADNRSHADGSRGAFASLVSCAPYHEVDFAAHKSVVVVIGGETEGISDDSVILAGSRNGARLNIPLDNEVESLNTGTALGIILFEIKRQLSLAMESKLRFKDVDDIQDMHGRSIKNS